MTGMFNSHADTECAAQQAVGQFGVKCAMVRTSPEARATGAGYNASQPNQETGVFASIRNLLLPDEDLPTYAEAMRRGGALVSARIGHSQVDRAADILEGAGAVGLDQQEARWRQDCWTGYDASAHAAAALPVVRTTAFTGRNGAISVVEERLVIGKREVDRGRMRVRSYLVGRPVEAQVRLEVERHPVNGPLTEADRAAAFQDCTIETTATSEEAVVGKEAQVVEEIADYKEAPDRVETVRRTEVEIESDANTSRMTGRTDTGMELGAAVDRTLGTNPTRKGRTPGAAPRKVSTGTPWFRTLRAGRGKSFSKGEEDMMKCAFLAMTIAAGAITALPAVAQQNQGGTAPPNREETVPLQLKAGQVMAMQQRLNEQGFSAGRVDGLWGPDTSAAVRNFQQKNGLRRTGQLDQGTLRALGIVGAAATSSVVASPAAALPATPDQGATTAPAPSSPPDTTAGRAMSSTALGTITNPAATGADPAAPAASAPDGTPGNAPGTALGRATDRTLGTNTTGTNPGGSNAGQNTAGSDSNQAVATTDANAPQPARGANSFSGGEARRRIERRGYTTVADLKKDGDGVWRGSATKDGAKVGVWLDYKGNIGQQ